MKKLHDLYLQLAGFTPTAILDKLKGAAGDQTRIGAEYMPEGFGAEIEPVSVSDASARKTAATYTGLDITPAIGMRVIQNDVPDVVWTLLDDADVTLDANWFGSPRTDSSGNLPLSGVLLTSDRRRIQTSLILPNYFVSGHTITTPLVGVVTTGGSMPTEFNSTATGLLSINVTVATGDRPAEYGAKIAAAWNANGTFAASYIARQVGPYLQVQRITAEAVPGTLAFTVNVGSAIAGVTLKTGSSSNQYAAYELGSFPVLASENVAEQHFIISGKANIECGAIAGTNLFLNTIADEHPSGIFNPIASSRPGVGLKLTGGGGSAYSSHLEYVAQPFKLKELAGSGGRLYVAGGNTDLGGIYSPKVKETVCNLAGGIGSYNILTPTTTSLTTMNIAPGSERDLRYVLFVQIDNAYASTLEVAVSLEMSPI